MEVKTNKDIRDFINFPLKLYKGCEFFVPPLYGEEKISDALLFAKDLKDRYSVLWAYYDIFSETKI